MIYWYSFSHVGEPADRRPISFFSNSKDLLSGVTEESGSFNVTPNHVREVISSRIAFINNRAPALSNDFFAASDQFCSY